MERILIVRLSSLGDIIHTLPAYSALRKHFSGAPITWIVGRKGKDILDLVPGIDDIVVFPEKGWLKKIKNRNMTAFDFQGLIKSGLVTFLSRAEKRFGFHRRNLKESLAGLFYTDRLDEVPENIHVINKNLKLLTLAGIKEDEYRFPILIPSDIKDKAAEKLRNIGFTDDRKLVIYNIGAAWPSKRWFPEKWVELAGLLENKELFPLLLWGNEEERRLALEIHSRSGLPPAPFFSIKEVMALIERAVLVISGDTFALQAACALSRPVVGIFGPTNPHRNGPFRTEDKTAYLYPECSPCYRRKCSSLECLRDISAGDVAALARLALENNA